MMLLVFAATSVLCNYSGSDGDDAFLHCGGSDDDDDDGDAGADENDDDDEEK